MKLRLAVGLLSMLVIGLAWARAEDTPAAKPAAEADAKPAAEKRPNLRLVFPYSQISSLSQEQKDKIIAIRVKVAEQLKALHEQETTDIMAVLTDEQKSEAKTLVEQRMSSRKAGAAAAPAAGDAPAAAAASEKKEADSAK
jgi:hypothetical protein